ncbi:Golgi apyrase [Coemansia nantahalensis]|uniref:Golgi apyrase n=2 Tax=Coemansia TaxID=4863 RepID=A0ACC1K5W9_9FUNG|nr:Golgi apyrase [Coemansia nantahalensis]
MSRSWASERQGTPAVESGVSLSGATRRRLRRWMAALGAAALLTLCVLGAVYTVLARPLPLPPAAPRPAAEAADGQRRYGVVIDAGSSGSRAMIYAWDDVRQQARGGNGLAAIARAGEQWTFKTDDGISSYAGRAHEVGERHIRPLLDFAQRAVPADRHAQTPVYLLATAGMRLVDARAAAEVLRAACAFAQANYAFQLADCDASFQVVSGEAEGLYGWVAVNYLMGGFGSGRSHGFLDMGGASAQIAFEPAPAAAAAHRGDLAWVALRTLDGRDREHGVFVATFLGHGTNEARRRYVDALRTAALEQTQARLLAVDDPCLARGLTLPTVDGRVVLRGGGDFGRCVAATEPLLNNTQCPFEPCLLGGVHAPEIDFGVQRFIGVSEYWYAAHDYLGLGGVWDVDRFEARAARFCRRPWAHIRPLAADPVHAGRLQMQCFKAAWLVNVLHRGFGVPRSAPSPVESVAEVAGTEVSWTLGALLLRVSAAIPPRAAHATPPGIRLPPRPPPAAAAAAAELADDALWSPVQFVGLRRLRVLWLLQSPGARGALLLAAGLVLCVGAAAAARKFARTRASRLQPHASPVLLRAVFASPHGPSCAATSDRQPTWSPPALAAPGTPPRSAAAGSPRALDSPALAGVLAEDALSISRSSSAHNLAMLNRRRG